MFGVGLVGVLAVWVVAVGWRALRGPAPERPIRFAVVAAVSATIHLGFHAAATAAPTLDAVALVLAGWSTFGSGACGSAASRAPGSARTRTTGAAPAARAAAAEAAAPTTTGRATAPAATTSTGTPSSASSPPTSSARSAPSPTAGLEPATD
jgi:hypothetical protein